jgi:hypothetical protein
MNVKDTKFLLLRIWLLLFLKNENYQNSNVIAGSYNLLGSTSYTSRKEFDIYQIVKPMLSINWTFIINKVHSIGGLEHTVNFTSTIRPCYFSILALFSNLKSETVSGVEHLRNN